MKWNIGKIASKRALFTPDNNAIIYEDTPITYKELNNKVNQVGAFFKEQGLKKGDRIAVALLNCPEFLFCYLAAAKLGLIFVPLNFRLVSRELEYQINKSGVRLLVFHDKVIKNIEPIRSQLTVEKDKFIYLKSFDSKDRNCPNWAVDYHNTTAKFPIDEPAPDEPIDMDDPLAILFTSGVTGDPKGAVISHGQTYFKNLQIIIYTDMRQDDVFLFQSPLCHSAGLCAVATPALCRGAALLMRAKFDPVLFARDIAKYKASIVFGLTTMFRFVLRTGELDKIDLSSVRVVFGGGERTPKTLIEELAKKGLPLQIGFGQTENSAMALMPRDAVLKKNGSCGLPNFFTDMWIQDDEGNLLLPGQIGNIVVSGPNVMSRYWDLPAETEETLKNGLLYTGDLGYFDEDGFLYVVDRAKDMYRSGGENVYPAEVERILADHPKIENVAIIGVPDDKWGETGMAFILPRQGQTLTKNEVLAFLNGKLARYKFPRQFKFVDSLPLTLWGKVRKSLLKEKNLS
jgi:fatty-acyl-CoA synthase